ncbi:MAG: MFS transporter [Oscillospiraceae bacterium]
MQNAISTNATTSMGKPFFKFLTVHTMFLVMTTLPGIFINTFLMAQTDDINIVLMYNGIFFIVGAATMVFAAYVLRRFNPGIVMVIGIVFYNILYLILLILQENASDFFVLLGMVIGVADGFYWIGYGTLLSTCTRLDNRDKGLAIISISGSVVNLVVPLFSGLVISRISGTKGYITVFGLAFSVALLTVFTALTLPKGESVKEPVQYKKTLALIKKEKCIQFGLLGQWSKGLREGTFTFIMGILLFKLVQNELLIGFNTFLSAISAILSYTIITRVLTRYNRAKYMGIAVCTLMIVNIVVLFIMGPLSLMFFTVIDAFCAGFIGNSCYSTFLDSMHVVPEASAHSPELFAVNDCILAVGRCLGLAVMITVNVLSGGKIVWLFAGVALLTCSQFITLALSKKAAYYIEQRHSKEIKE